MTAETTKAKILKQMQEHPDHKHHGTRTGYVYGCRCERCVQANREYSLAQYYCRKNTKSEINSKKRRLKELQTNPNDQRHGTVYAYKLGCRCEKCQAAEAANRKETAAKKLKELQENPNDPRHGTTSSYAVGCRCEKCKAASREYAHCYRLTPQGKVILKKCSFRKKDKALKELKADPSDRRHGTVYGYDCGCRCEKCKEAKEEYLREYRRRQHGED